MNIWWKANKLTINRCNLLIILPKLNQIIFEFSIQLYNSSVVARYCVKYLGVYTGSKLTFQNHLNIVKNKVSRAVRKISKWPPFDSMTSIRGHLQLPRCITKQVFSFHSLLFIFIYCCLCNWNKLKSKYLSDTNQHPSFA